MNFIFECWKYLSWVSKAHSALEDKICIPKQPCNILYVDHIKYSCLSFQWCMHAWCFSPKLIPKLNIVVRICLQDMWPHTAQSKSINASVLYRLKIKIRANNNNHSNQSNNHSNHAEPHVFFLTLKKDLFMIENVWFTIKTIKFHLL